MLISVVLPAPFGPMMDRISPGDRLRFTSSLATRPENRLVMPCTCRRAAHAGPLEDLAKIRSMAPATPPRK